MRLDKQDLAIVWWERLGRAMRRCDGAVFASRAHAQRQNTGAESGWQELNRDDLRRVPLTRRSEVSAFDTGLSRRVGRRRSVLVFENRLLEILVYLVVGIVCLVLGLLSANVNYRVIFFILTAFFFFAIFRPTSLS